MADDRTCRRRRGARLDQPVLHAPVRALGVVVQQVLRESVVVFVRCYEA